jgi:nucleoside 2-deoxyribosyltransferase
MYTLKIFIASKYFEDNRNKQLIEDLSDIIKERGFEPVCVIRDVEKWGTEQLSPRELMVRTFAAIDGCGIVLVELSTKGVGLGIEAGYAFARKKRILTIAPHNMEVSKTLAGISTKVCNYYDLSEVGAALDEIKGTGEPENKAEFLDLYKIEYQMLKDEAIKRIGFRDNLIYVMLVAIGAVASFGVSKAENSYALLIIPWVCVILGWTYLANDEKISHIGAYIRRPLVEKITRSLGQSGEEVFGWEVFHRSDKGRLRRKILQFTVDLFTFCISGLVAITAFWLLNPAPLPIISVFAGAEIVVLLFLGLIIFRRTDFRRGR